MTSQAQSIYVPCEVLHVRAIIAPSKSALPIRNLVLEMLARRSEAPTLDELARMFGIGTRPMLDIVRPLWYTGLLVVDPDRGTIAVTASARANIEQRSGDAFVEGSWSEERVTVFRELVGGHIVKALRFAGQRPGFTIPEAIPPSGGHLSAYEYAELVETVQRVLRKTFAKQDRILIRAIPVLQDPSVVSARRAIRLRAIVTDEGSMGGMQFTVIEPQRIPARIRADLGRRLSRSAADNPDLLVYKNIRRRITTDLRDDIAPLERALGRLAELCADIPRLTDEEVANHHDDCAAVAGEVRAQLATSLEPDPHISILTGESAFCDAVRFAIRTAREQVVVTCPFATLSGIDRFKAEVTEAAQVRGVRVVFVWGLTATDEFLRILMQLAEVARRGSILRPLEAARVHAKLVVRDADYVVVGSPNFLGDSSAAAQVGIVVESRPGDACGIAVEILKWARECIPAFHIRHSVTVPEYSPNAAQRLPDVPRPPRHLNDDGRRLADAPASLKAWQLAWEQFLARVSDLAGDAGKAASIVTDAEHRSMLIKAIESARWRLLIASDRLSDVAVDALVERELRRRVEGGLPTVLLWRRAADSCKKLVSRLRALAEAFPSTLWLIESNNHAKVLLWDDDVIVTSFNFLSFDWAEDSARRNRFAREMGVRVRTPEAVTGVVTALEAQLAPGTLSGWLASAVRPETSSRGDQPSATDPAAAQEVQRLLERLGGAGAAPASRRAVLRAFFSRAKAPGEVLETILKLGVPAEDRYVAILCALSRTETRAHPSWPQWVATIADHLWRNRRFFDAAAVLSVLDGHGVDDALPSPAIALLGSVLHAPQVFADRLTSVWASNPTPRELEASCALGVYTLAATGAGGVVEPLAELRVGDGLGHRLVDAYLRAWWEATSSALPVDAIKRLRRDDANDATRSTLRDKLLAALEQGARRRFPAFPPGERTLEAMFGPEGSLQPLFRAAVSDDPAAADDFLRRIKTTEDIVMDAWIQARDRAERLEGNFRLTIARLATKAIAAARSWTESSTDAAVQLPEYEMKALLALRGQLLTLMPEMEARTQVAIVGPPWELCYEYLAPLIRWRS